MRAGLDRQTCTSTVCGDATRVVCSRSRWPATTRAEKPTTGARRRHSQLPPGSRRSLGYLHYDRYILRWTSPDLSLRSFKRYSWNPTCSLTEGVRCPNNRPAPLWLYSEFGAAYKYTDLPTYAMTLCRFNNRCRKNNEYLQHWPSHIATVIIIIIIIIIMFVY